MNNEKGIIVEIGGERYLEIYGFEHYRGSRHLNRVVGETEHFVLTHTHGYCSQTGMYGCPYHNPCYDLYEKYANGEFHARWDKSFSREEAKAVKEEAFKELQMHEMRMALEFEFKKKYEESQAALKTAIRYGEDMRRAYDDLKLKFDKVKEAMKIVREED